MSFAQSAKLMLDTFGSNCTYKTVTPGVYNVNTSTMTNTVIDTTVRTYKRHMKATQYNYPDLIGKETAEFYLLGSQFASKPKAGDKIVHAVSDTYSVYAVQEHSVNGVVVVYCVVGVKA